MRRHELPQMDAALMQRARTLARASGRDLVVELEQLTGLGQRELVFALAAPFAMEVFETADMLARTPMFELMPLSKAMQRHCVLLKGADDRLVGVVGDPFDADLQTWIESRAGQAVRYVLALPTDIQAYLSKLEESVRAVDHLVAQTGDPRKDSKTIASLSFASVSEAASPAVKLVNSTLYDALKAGASDIHLESTPVGLVVKYRVDGVLDHATSVAGVEVAEQVVSRIKVLAELDIAERTVKLHVTALLALLGARNRTHDAGAAPSGRPRYSAAIGSIQR